MRFGKLHKGDFSDLNVIPSMEIVQAAPVKQKDTIPPQTTLAVLMPR